MSVIGKILTLLRGSARELGESVVDANAARIYEQEVVDARNALRQARQELTTVMAREMQSAREIERVRAEAARLEALALEALAKQREDLAEEVAGKIADTEAELAEHTRAHANYTLQVGKLKELIKQADAKIREHEREVAMARTTESVYRATQAISGSIGASGSKLVSARESLERIKRRHEELADRLAAGEALEREMGTGALEARLAEAGIGANSDGKRAVMARLRARQGGADGSTT